MKPEPNGVQHVNFAAKLCRVDRKDSLYYAFAPCTVRKRDTIRAVNASAPIAAVFMRSAQLRCSCLPPCLRPALAQDKSSATLAELRQAAALQSGSPSRCRLLGVKIVSWIPV